MSSPSPHFYQHVADIFNKAYDDFSGSVSSLGWASEFTQEQRFLMLSLLSDMENKTVLDVGCGMGDFYSFLLLNGVDCRYTGIDISEKMINHAKKAHPETHFELRNLLDLPATPTYDIVVASGPFNHKTDEPYAFIEPIITHMFSLCKTALAFNLLSASTPASMQDTKSFTYYSPSKILDICLKLTPYIELKQAYLPNDFTVYLYKPN